MSFTHFEQTLNIVPEQLTERVWCTKSQSSLLNIYFRLSGFQSPLLLLRSKHPKTLRQRAAETYPICDNPLAVVQHGAASLRNRHRAEITVFMCEQKPYPVWFSCQRKSYLVWHEHSLRACLHGGGGPQVGEVTCGG